MLIKIDLLLLPKTMLLNYITFLYKTVLKRPFILIRFIRQKLLKGKLKDCEWYFGLIRLNVLI